MAFSPDSRTVSGNVACSDYVWDTLTEARRHKWELSDLKLESCLGLGELDSLTFSPDRTTFAMGRLDAAFAPLGRQEVGFSTDKRHAAYWDGRNESGELATNGIYLYEFRAGIFRASIRMAMAKQRPAHGTRKQPFV